MLKWKDAVWLALLRYTQNNQTIQVSRPEFLRQELAHIIEQTASTGNTPAQTISRVLQELRDEGKLFFSNAGVYTLSDVPVVAEQEDLPEDVLENAITHNRLFFNDVLTQQGISQARTRKGMQALRKKTLDNYQCQCALCDIDTPELLVTSHIARWADAPEARGHLANTLCLCTLHDRLFENGHFTLSNQLDVVWLKTSHSQALAIWQTQCTGRFKLPIAINPSLHYIQQHRARFGQV